MAIHLSSVSASTPLLAELLSVISLLIPIGRLQLMCTMAWYPLQELLTHKQYSCTTPRVLCITTTRTWCWDFARKNMRNSKHDPRDFCFKINKTRLKIKYTSSWYLQSNLAYPRHVGLYNSSWNFSCTLNDDGHILDVLDSTFGSSL